MPGWTLNFEMVFYVLICTALMLYRQHFVALVSLVLVLIYGLGYFYPAASVGRLFFHDSLWLEFILGMACFKLHRHPLIRAVPKIVFVLILMVSATVLVYFENWADRFISAGLPCFLILLSALQFEERLRSMHSRFLRFLVHIGDASYATYLSHMFVIGAVERMLFRWIGIEEKDMATALFTISCCLLVGSLIYKLIDAPMLETSRRFTKRLRFALS
jgi:peptidoglycan/LPS O-acetylase OafA/YrhL